jgi:hypothetical protein
MLPRTKRMHPSPKASPAPVTTATPVPPRAKTPFRIRALLGQIGEISDSAGRTRAIEAVDERDQTRQIRLLPGDRTPAPLLKHPKLKLRLDHIELARPRQWGGCWPDKTTLSGMLKKITGRHGKEWRTRTMDRGIQNLWWRPFEKINAISTIWIRKIH